MNVEDKISLYDFLGKPAGKELGKNVFLKAKSENIEIGLRDVSTKNYTGKVMLYPMSFLTKYFKIDDNLPF